MNGEDQKPVLLITGASGLLGTAVALAAWERFRLVLVSSRFSVSLNGAGSHVIDLRNTTSALELLDREKPGIIVHLAAATNVDWCEQNKLEATDINVGITQTLSRWAERNGALIVLMSTDSVFDGARGSYTEADLPAPINHYAKTKLDSETAVSGVSENLIIRANLYGWNAQPKQSLAEWVVFCLQGGNQIQGFDDVVFAPLLCTSLADRILELIYKRARGIVHLASRNAISKYDFAIGLASKFNLPKRLISRAKSSDRPWCAPRPLNTSLTATRAAREFAISLPTTEGDLQDFHSQGRLGYPLLIKSICRKRT